MSLVTATWITVVDSGPAHAVVSNKTGIAGFAQIPGHASCSYMRTNTAGWLAFSGIFPSMSDNFAASSGFRNWQQSLSSFPHRARSGYGRTVCTRTDGYRAASLRSSVARPATATR
jgi:hypothetical protein